MMNLLFKFALLGTFICSFSMVAEGESHSGSLSYGSVDPEFHSELCQNESRFLEEQKKKFFPSYVALLSFACGWSGVAEKMDALGYPLNLKTETLRFQNLWKQVARQKFSSRPSIRDYWQLTKAVTAYQDQVGVEDSPLSLEPGSALISLITDKKLNPSNPQNLYFILKLFDCELLDGESFGSIGTHLTHHVFSVDGDNGTVTRGGNTSTLLKEIMNVEKEHIQESPQNVPGKIVDQIKEVVPAHGGRDACSADFDNISPMEAFAQAVMASSIGDSPSLNELQRQQLIYVANGDDENKGPLFQSIEDSDFPDEVPMARQNKVRGEMYKSLERFKNTVLRGEAF